MLNIIAVDDDRLCLDNLCEMIPGAAPSAHVERFTSAQQAYDYLCAGNKCDVLFVDLAMEGGKGLELARRARMATPGLNVIAATPTGDFAAEAMELHASGYIVKPVTFTAVKRELDDLRYTPGGRYEPGKRVRAQCFGNFELFVDGRAVRFKYKKTRELIAYLIDRCGSICTGPEITAALWEEDMEEHPAYLKSLIRDLTKTLTELGCEEILEKQWGGLGIRTDLIECDYYNWKKGITAGINTYRGEYMSQYSWGEFTNAGQMSSSGLL